MDVRLAARADLSDVLALLDAVFVGHVAEGDRAEGYLSLLDARARARAEHGSRACVSLSDRHDALSCVVGTAHRT